MVGWYHWLYGHEYEQALGVGDGQGSLVCYSPWGHKESDMNEKLDWTELWFRLLLLLSCFSHGRLCATPWIAARQASLSITNSWSLLKLMSIESVISSIHLIPCCPLLLLPSIFPGIRVFSNESVLSSGGQNIGASASASVLPMNIQDWFPLEWTSLISLQFKGLSRVFSNTTVLGYSQLKIINSSVLSFLCGPTLTSIHDHWKNHTFNYMNLCWQSYVSAF